MRMELSTKKTVRERLKPKTPPPSMFLRERLKNSPPRKEYVVRERLKNSLSRVAGETHI